MLIKNVSVSIDSYNRLVKQWENSDKKTSLEDFLSQHQNGLKWTRQLKASLKRKAYSKFKQEYFRVSLYRPFIKKHLYFDTFWNEEQYQIPRILPTHKSENKMICVSGISSNKPFQVLVTNLTPCLDILEKTQCFPFYRYDDEGKPIENMTDWGLNQFRQHYQQNEITKEDIFHYTYAVLHHAAYREKYLFNLKREFPRLPFYKNFPQWATWGKQLMALHLNYETVEKYPLKRHDKKLGENKPNKLKFKVDKNVGKILLDDITSLVDIPPVAWDYKLGNRCALEWVLDQYKEKKPRNSTTLDNTYHFVDYKEQVIELLQRVCTVSVATMKIIGEFENERD